MIFSARRTNPLSAHRVFSMSYGIWFVSGMADSGKRYAVQIFKPGHQTQR
jgi:hypothetical protein